MQTDRQRGRHAGTQTQSRDTVTDGQTNTQINRQTADTQTDRQTHRQTHPRHIDRYLHSSTERGIAQHSETRERAKKRRKPPTEIRR